jgi:FimV-like protein
MELADAWMTLQNPAKVLEILEPFSSVDQPESPLPWLCLLDVYRALGDRKKYEAILERIKKIYNVKLAPWDPVVDAEPPKSLSDFPHIIDNVKRLWGTEAVITYLDKLLLDNREGTRNGFDLPVYRDILRLLDLANDPNGPKTREEIVREIELRTTTHRSMHAQPQPAAPAVAQAGANSPAAKPAAAESEDTAPRKPLLRERPKYITTSYHRKIAKPTIYIPDDAAPIPSSLLSEPETENNPLPEILLADERSITESHVAESVAAHQQAVEPRAATQEPVSEYDEMSPIAIKLHLAIAYQDIGDRDGARLLLDEVIQGGTPEQVEQAKELLTKLG